MTDVDLLSVVRRWYGRNRLSTREITKSTGLSEIDANRAATFPGFSCRPCRSHVLTLTQGKLTSNECQEPCHLIQIQTAIAIIIRFSVNEMNPSGTLLSPPTQAHFSSRLSI